MHTTVRVRHQIIQNDKEKGKNYMSHSCTQVPVRHQITQKQKTKNKKGNGKRTQHILTGADAYDGAGASSNNTQIKEKEQK